MDKKAQELLYVPPTVQQILSVMNSLRLSGPAVEVAKKMDAGEPLTPQDVQAALADLPNLAEDLSPKMLATFKKMLEGYGTKLASIIRTAQSILPVPADPGMLEGRIKQIAATNNFMSSALLAFMAAATSGGPVDEALRAAALEDVANYHEDRASLGLSERQMKSVVDFVSNYGKVAAAATQKLLTVAAKFKTKLGKTA